MTTNLISTNDGKDSYNAAISPDNRYVVFTSDTYNSTREAFVANVFVKDLANGSLRQITDNNFRSGSGGGATFSTDSRYAIFMFPYATGTRSYRYETFVHDLATGTTELYDPQQYNFELSDHQPTISTNGRYKVFQSEDNNLVAEDLNAEQDIFVEDLIDNTVRIVSVDNDGVSAYGIHDNPRISQNGRYVFFKSDADNLVEKENKNYSKIFVRDLVEGTTKRVLFNNTDSDRYASWDFELSEDNRYLIFETEANVTDDDTDDYTDVFIHDLGESFANLATEEVTIPEPSDRSNEPVTKQIPYFSANFSSAVSSQKPLISDDGNVVFFELTGEESKYEGIYTSQKDDSTDYYNLSPAQEIFGYSRPKKVIQSGKNIDLSSNGSLVFASGADNLVSGDTGDFTDIFIRSQSGSITRVSVDSEGFQANSNSNNPHVSHDGNYVVFTSYADNLVSDDDNGWQNIFVRNLAEQTTQIVNVANDGTQANRDSYEPIVSNDGRYVVFSSDADNLVSNDEIQAQDIFVRDLVKGTTELVNVSDNGSQLYSPTSDYDFSPDGRYVAFSAYDYDFEDEGTYYRKGIFVRDLKNETTRKLDLKFTENVSASSYWSYSVKNLRISDGGRYVFFESDSNYLIAEDSNHRNDIFVYDLSTNTSELISAANNIYSYPDKSYLHEDSYDYDISPDGRYVAFYSDANYLVGGDNSGKDLFIRDRGASVSLKNEEYYNPIIPKVNITSIELDEYSNQVNINYSAFDEDSEAKISLHYDNDNSMDNGFETITNNLVEQDGIGSYIWHPNSEIAAGNYYLFATIDDGDAGEYFSNYFEEAVEIISFNSLPIVSNPLADIVVDENAADKIINLSNVFDDADGDQIVVQLKNNSNPQLATATVNGTKLTLAFTADMFGSGEITLEATANGDKISDTFSFKVKPVETPTIDDETKIDTPDTDNQSKFSLADVHRFYQYEKGFHLYTADNNEINSIKQKSLSGELSYNYEAERYRVLNSDRDLLTGDTIEGVKPIYRFFNAQTGAHLYTMSDVEKSYIQDNLFNYSFEGIKYYAFETAPLSVETIPVYRMLNTQSGAHLFTSDLNEINYIQENLSNFFLENNGNAAFHVFEL